MTSEALDDDDCYEPQRDQRGRFKRGSSGNPRGRRPKRPDPEWTVDECFARALAEEVTVSGPGRSQQKMAVRDLLITSAVRDAVKANVKDKIYIIERLAKLQFLKPPAGVEPEEIFTEEDRRLLELVQREYIEHICCQCGKPDVEKSWRRPARDDFKFG